ncbi:fimbrial protein [Pasteurellaceae bacterium RH1A]|nr:fimbrial protein [Pasteurellaceae bacterium RH1A]
MFKVYGFRWRAVNRFGQKQAGKLLAPQAQVAEQALLKKGYDQIRLSRNFVLPKQPKFEEVTQLLNQLALLLNATIPLKQALVMVLENCSQIRLYQWVSFILQQLEAGFTFSVILEKEGKYLKSQEIQLIKMAERSGNLPLILSNIAESRAKSEKLAKKVKKILFYPVIVLFISLSLSLMLLIFIVPQFAELYQSKDSQLPFITQILFSLSNFLKNNSGFLVFLLLQAAIVLKLLANKTNLIPRLKLAILSRMPVFKTIISHSRLIFFSQNLGLMLNAHLRLDTALASFLSDRPDDPVLNREILFMQSILKQGYRLADGLNINVFDNQAVQMLAVGERSGQLAKMLAYVADLYQQKLDYQIDMLSQLLEPLLMVVMGLIVGVIMVGLYLPIFDMGAMVG